MTSERSSFLVPFFSPDGENGRKLLNPNFDHLGAELLREEAEL